MEEEDSMVEDAIFQDSEARHLITVGFLSALLEHLGKDKALEIAEAGFANYMVIYYRNVFNGTKEGTQERFDVFRSHYELMASKSTYCQVVESSPSIFKIKYTRCPFYEVMLKYHLSDMAYAFCLSDAAFTEKVLPKVRFQRDQVIATGGEYCNHTWHFTNGNDY